MTDLPAPIEILLAIDGSEHSLTAAETICSLPLPTDSKITILAVLDTPHTLRRQLLLAAISQIQECLNKKGIAVESGLLHGHPAEALSSFADEHHPDLIVLGAKGLRATLGILLGGITQQIVEYAHWPVLIVRPPARLFKKILAATDGSGFSIQALEYIRRFPLPLGSEIHLAYVVPPQPDLQRGGLPHVMLGGVDSLHPFLVELLEDAEKWQEQAEENGRSILEANKVIFSQSSLKVLDNLLHGDAATEILKYSKDHDIDLIVAGSRGLSQVRGWLLGSVSRKLVHYANCSVLIVRKNT